jgi:hypothetical protein
MLEGCLENQAYLDLELAKREVTPAELRKVVKGVCKLNNHELVTIVRECAQAGTANISLGALRNVIERVCA